MASQPDELLPHLPMAEGGPDLEAGAAALAAWTAMDQPSAEGCAAVGHWALQARTASETAWVEATGGSLGLSAWPEKDLRISVVDAKTGERRLFDRSSGVPLSRAVAASCAVPGLFPPIDIDGRRYMDGGVWSGTHADFLIAEAPELVVVIAPMVEGVVVFGELMERTLDEEIRGLEAVGSRVLQIVPKAEDREVFGPNMMDSTRSKQVRLFARERGRALAQAEDWGAFA
jgi:NTE family protein